MTNMTKSLFSFAIFLNGLGMDFLFSFLCTGFHYGTARMRLYQADMEGSRRYCPLQNGLVQSA